MTENAPHDTSTSLPAFSAEAFVEQLGGDLEFAADLSRVFVEDTAQRIAQLEQAYAAANYEAAWHLAHSIKGAAGSLGADAVAHVALQIELTGKRGEFAAMAPLIPLLISTFASTRKALDDHLAGHQ